MPGASFVQKADPFTITRIIDWKDYTVAADVRLPRYGAAALIARIDSADVFKDENALYPSGYVLKVNADGDWELLSTAFNRGAATEVSGRFH